MLGNIEMMGSATPWRLRIVLPLVMVVVANAVIYGTVTVFTPPKLVDVTVEKVVLLRVSL